MPLPGICDSLGFNRRFRGIIELDGRTMQNIAAEIGFSETAFIKKLSDNEFHIRFFTPKKEISFCGHATLAAAKIIFEITLLDDIHFFNVEGTSLIMHKTDGGIEMKFPVYDTSELFIPKELPDALGVNTLVETRFNQELNIILLEIKDTVELANLQPDFVRLMNSSSGINGVLVTAKSYDGRTTSQFNLDFSISKILLHRLFL